MLNELRPWVPYLIILVLAGWMLRRHGWRSLLVLKPTALKLEADAPADQIELPSSLEKRAVDLINLGFVSLGSHLERAPLRTQTLGYDYGHPSDHAFATLSEGSEGPRLYFLTETNAEAFALTADYRRPAQDQAGHYRSGALEGVSVDRLYKAHQRRAGELGDAKAVPCTMDGRIEVGRRWLQGPGGRELRQQNLLGLLWTVGTVGMVVAAVFGRRG